MARTEFDASPFSDNLAYEPVSSRERNVASIFVGALLAANAVLAPFVRLHLSVVPAFLPIIETAAFTGLCLTAAMLYSQYRVGRHAPLAILACAFAVHGVLQIPYLLTFPGVFSGEGLLGAGPQTAVWLYVLSRLAFAILILLYILKEREQRNVSRPDFHILPIATGSLVFAILTIFVVTLGQRSLPTLILRHGAYASLYPQVVIPIVLFSLVTSLAALIVITRLQVRVHLWLAIMLISAILEVCVSGLMSGGRYTLGWYLARADLAIDATLFIVLMHAQLASILSRSAQSGERAHSIYEFVSIGHKHLADDSKKMLAFAQRSLGFECAFIAQLVDNDLIVDTSVGDLATLSIYARLEQDVLIREALALTVLLEGSSKPSWQLASTRNTWSSYAVIPIVVDDTPFGILAFASTNKRARRLNEADKTFIRLVAVLAGSNIERAGQHRRLDELAFFDPLTGLPNRALLMDRLRQAIAEGKRHVKSFTVYFLDVDYFKSINDRYGHGAGDDVLREIGRRLSALVRETDTVARYGGDEFIILAPDLTSSEDASIIPTRIKNVFRQPVVVSAGSLTVKISAGASRFRVDGEDADTLLRAADEALYRAKAGRAPSGQPVLR